MATKSKGSNYQFEIVTSEGSPEFRGDRISRLSERVRRVAATSIKSGMEEFAREFSAIVANIGDRPGAFVLGEVEVSAQMTAKGTIQLLGSGLATEGAAGIRFKFVKRA